jgi:hypothetical protein
MKGIFFLICLQMFAAQASTFETKNLAEIIEVKPGDEVIYGPTNYKIMLQEIRVYKSECAIPGKNCGSGYFPEPQNIPIFKVTADKGCEVAPQPSKCEIIHHVVSMNKTESLKLIFTNVFEICEKDTNKDNKASCIINMTKNNYDKPARDPSNCNRILDYDERIDECYEAVADKLGDHKICDKMKRPIGFQCMLLKAANKRDPELCRTLKRGAYDHSEADWKSKIEACVNATKRLK